MQIVGEVEKSTERPFKKHILIEIDEDDSIILEQSLLSFEKYDQDDTRYIAKLDHVKEQTHKIWALLHPS